MVRGPSAGSRQQHSPDADGVVVARRHQRGHLDRQLGVVVIVGVDAGGAARRAALDRARRNEQDAVLRVVVVQLVALEHDTTVGRQDLHPRLVARIGQRGGQAASGGQLAELLGTGGELVVELVGELGPDRRRAAP